MTRVGFVRLTGGAHVTYEVRNEAGDSTILLLRPLGGSIALWEPFISELAKQHRVIAFDPRGVRASSDPSWVFSTRAMAHDARQLLDHLGVGIAHVFGLSLGGMVATWLAIDDSTRVRSLVLASTLMDARATSLAGFAKLCALAARVFFATDAEVSLARGVLSAWFRAHHPERVAAIAETVRSWPAKRTNLLKLSLAARLHRVDANGVRPDLPVLLLFGELDPLAHPSARADLYAQLGAPEVRVLPKAGHDLSLERPELLAVHVLDFVGRAEATASRS